MTDEQVLQQMEMNFPEISAKFRRGMTEYKDNPLFSKDCVYEALNETFDLLAYITTIKIQHARIVKLIMVLSNNYNIPLEDNNIRELLDLLKTKS